MGSPSPWGCHTTTLLQISIGVRQRGAPPLPADTCLCSFRCCLGMLGTYRHPPSTQHPFGQHSSGGSCCPHGSIMEHTGPNQQLT